MATNFKIQNLSKSNLTSRTQTPEFRPTSETHWVRDWNYPAKPAAKHSSQFPGSVPPTEFYPFQIKSWIRSDSPVPLNFDSPLDDTFDLSQYRYGSVVEDTAEKTAGDGLSAADIRGAVGGSNTIFSSSTDAQEGQKVEPEPIVVEALSAVTEVPDVATAEQKEEAMDVDLPASETVVEADVAHETQEAQTLFAEPTIQEPVEATAEPVAESIAESSASPIVVPAAELTVDPIVEPTSEPIIQEPFEAEQTTEPVIELAEPTEPVDESVSGPSNAQLEGVKSETADIPIAPVVFTPQADVDGDVKME
ncbi:hypothetical protein BABINDRAFT_12186 [Babjeviella inositovora NRRL Y-12698]|uniref:Uncharacterized protein n=1 Tax=Babjeviella inositovora NRRL Y-12698 TaxID=984486 RepID=A0A1E3QYJ0_9ASCO|nr:uncharacterized protein BABINDRAFT_12186 [Babjeviella inositovora NRRL Y-12698]ODQ82147.1 hypothetical protein BABINDRAFT_12186 [Babjeviella inositovora NRRL Y-12698]